MSKKVIIIHEANAFCKDIIAMTMPLFLMALFYYGPKVILLMLLAWLTARLADRLAALMRSQRYDATDNSSVAIAFVTVLLLPVTVRLRVVVVAVLAGVFLAKEAFGGYGRYPFNPAAVGFCVAGVSWPEEVLNFPQPINWIASLGGGNWENIWNQWIYANPVFTDGPSRVLRSGSMPNIDSWNLILGNYGASMGTACIVVIFACGVYLFIKKRLPLAAPLCYVAIVVLIAFAFPRYSEIGWSTFPGDILDRLNVVKYELFSGGLLYACVFLIPEPVTLPKTPASQAAFGLVLGFAVMMFRYFGTYEVGTCFAIILVSAVFGYFDRPIARWAQRREAKTP